MHKNRKDREDGFTLIELIIVVVILGILTAVAIPSYGAIQRTSEKRSMTVAGQSAAKDLQARYASTGGPSGQDDGRTVAKGSTADGGIATYTTWFDQQTIAERMYVDDASGYGDGVFCSIAQKETNDGREYGVVAGDVICQEIYADYSTFEKVRG